MSETLAPNGEDDTDYGDLRANSFKEGEDDADQSPYHGPQFEHGKSLLTNYPTNQFYEG